jgi:hypothetical protein
LPLRRGDRSKRPSALRDNQTSRILNRDCLYAWHACYPRHDPRSTFAALNHRDFKRALMTLNSKELGSNFNRSGKRATKRLTFAMRSPAIRCVDRLLFGHRLFVIQIIGTTISAKLIAWAVLVFLISCCKRRIFLLIAGLPKGRDRDLDMAARILDKLRQSPFSVEELAFVSLRQGGDTRKKIRYDLRQSSDLV